PVPFVVQRAPLLLPAVPFAVQRAPLLLPAPDQRRNGKGHLTPLALKNSSHREETPARADRREYLANAGLMQSANNQQPCRGHPASALGLEPSRRGQRRRGV